MQDPPPPTDLDQVESLILSLYQQNPPDVIARAQATLSQLQSTPQAWSLARHLLERPREEVKFFGALTIIVKLNKESQTLDESQVSELLFGLIQWYLNSFEPGNGPLVARKLSSAISTFFHHFHQTWPKFLRHLTLCLASHRSIQPHEVNDSTDPAQLFHSFGTSQLQAILWVVNNILDDASRLDLNTAKNAMLYNAILQNASDAVALMSRCILQTPSAAAYEDSVKCLQSWIWFAQRAPSKDIHIIQMLRPLIAAVMSALPTAPSDEVSVELLTETLSNYPALFTESDFNSLSSIFLDSWFQHRYERLLQGDFDFDIVRFGQLLLAFGEARVDMLVSDGSDRNKELLSRLCGLLTADGYPVVDDKIFVPAIEFWSTYAETMTDTLDADEDPGKSWAPYALSNVLDAISNSWRKITYPPPEELLEWDSNDRTAFNDARKDVIDLLQSTYTLAGSRLAVTFTDLALSALHTSSWLTLEAAVYCLGGLADCNREDEQFNAALSSIFTSPLFSILQSTQYQIPHKTRQTCLTLIEQYTEYFEDHIDLLPSALRLLFTMLSEHSVSVSASKSILRLCSSCRIHLYSEAGALLDQYQGLVEKQQLDCMSSEKILGAIASVTQAIPDGHGRNATCARILIFIQSDITTSKQLISSGDSKILPCAGKFRCAETLVEEHPALHVALRAMRCLVSVGKGLQAPAETSVDLETDAVSSPNTDVEVVQLQGKVLNIIVELQNAFPRVSAITELACSVLRSGFSEIATGPFVIQPNNVAQFFVSYDTNTPGIGAVVRTACSFLSSAHFTGHSGHDELLSSILMWAIGLLRQLSGPEADPELSQNGVEFVTRLFTKNPQTLLNLQPPDAAEFFFVFSLQVLDGREPLPKAAAAEFWSAFTNSRNEQPGVQEAIKQAMDLLGPMVSQSLARNIGGNASRSELDKLSEPLKKLVSRYPRSKDWLQAALSDSSFPSDKVSADQKSTFVRKIISLRGSRATNQVVRDFWLAARGTSFSYAS